MLKQIKIERSTMSGFKALRDVSIRFEHELQQASQELFSAKPNFVDDIEEKLKDLALVSSKQKLLDAKPLSSTPEVLKSVSKSTPAEYGDTAVGMVLEQVTAKSLTQFHSVTALIHAPDSSLDAEMIERKNAILDSLEQFSNVERELRHLNSQSLEAESQAAATRNEWDRALAELRDCQDQRNEGEESPMDVELSTIVEKLEVMRWLIGRLICAPSAESQTPYDWLADPHGRMEALPLTRQRYTVEGFTAD